jgi:hypothetical protein
VLHGDRNARSSSNLSVTDGSARYRKRQMVSNGYPTGENGDRQPAADRGGEDMNVTYLSDHASDNCTFVIDLSSPDSSLDCAPTDSLIDKSLQESDGFDHSFIQQTEELPSWPVRQTPRTFLYGIDNVVYDLGFQQSQTADFSSSPTADLRVKSVSFDITTSGMTTGRILEMDRWDPQGNADDLQWENNSLYGPAGGSIIASSPLATSTIDIGYGNIYSIDMESVSPGTRVPSGSTLHFANAGGASNWEIPPQIPQVYGDDIVLIRHYESTMSGLFSVKSPQWNLYTYMLRSPQGTSNSPLRNSILAWTSLHLSRRDDNPLNNGAMYYTNASNAVKDLLKELSSATQATALAFKSTWNAKKLYMVLSTLFFLSQCDFMICDRRAFSERLNALKLVLAQNWETLRGELDRLASRLLIWLAYLDLRASLWGNPSPVGRIGDAQNRVPVLLDMLGDLKALPSLRSISDNQSYLSECFGDNYPSTELREDLIQEPMNALSDDIMCVLSRVKGFETWNDEMIRRGAYKDDAVVRELRTTKVQALRAEIGRIRAVRIASCLLVAHNVVQR